MQVTIARIEGGYVARVTPSHGDDVAWSTNEPMKTSELIAKLAALGFHQQDIGDALYQADPDWVTKAD